MMESLLHHINLFESSRLEGNIEVCLDSLRLIKTKLQQNKNYSLVEQISTGGVEVPTLLFYFYELKFDCSVHFSDGPNILDYFYELERIYFNTFFDREDFENFWQFKLLELKRIKNPCFEIEILKRMISFNVESLISFNYKLTIPMHKKISELTEILVYCFEDKRALKAVRRFLNLVNNNEVLGLFFNTFPDARAKRFSDNFMLKLSEKVKTQEQEQFILPVTPIPEQTHCVQEVSENTLSMPKTFEQVSYFISAEVTEKINFNIMNQNLEIALKDLELKFKNCEKDLDYYYLKAFLIKRLEGSFECKKFLAKHLESRQDSLDFLKMLLKLSRV
jgi:hypothetical protein